MKLETEMAIIEAILFMENEPVDLRSLSRIAGLSKEGVAQALDQLREVYLEDQHGLELVEADGTFQFLPKRQFWEQLKERYGKKNDAKLSRAAMETLSIIAYSQPITRAEIEGVRGVSSDAMIRLLSDRGLVHEIGKKDAPGKPSQFGTTKEFLKLFHLSSLVELPKLDELEKKRFELN
jgi:segregation and condensation protein B